MIVHITTNANISINTMVGLLTEFDEMSKEDAYNLCKKWFNDEDYLHFRIDTEKKTCTFVEIT